MTDKNLHQQLDAGTGGSIRIWVLHMLFKKDGSPSLGTFGQTERPVVILPLQAWQTLCAEIPELGKRRFEVGSYD